MTSLNRLIPIALAALFILLQPVLGQAATTMPESGSQDETLFTYLTEQHGAVSLLMTEIRTTGNDEAARRESLFNQLLALYLTHGRSEELTVYPAFVQNPSTEEMGYEAFQEHHVSYLSLYELHLMPKNTSLWMAKFANFMEMVHMHVAEEEVKVFKKADEQFSDQQLSSVLSSIKTAQTAIMAAIEDVGVRAALAGIICDPLSTDLVPDLPDSAEGCASSFGVCPACQMDSGANGNGASGNGSMTEGS